MTKRQLIAAVSAGLPGYTPRDIDRAVRQIFSSLIAAIAREERIDLRGFGNFTVRHRAPKQGRNPKTGLDIAVGHRRVVFFKAGKELTRKING
jgi:integration host factor subunit beta